VKLGKKYFPRCSDVLDKIMDDNLTELTAPDRDTSEEKRRRFNDLQDVLKKAFSEDRQELDRCAHSSSSSTTIHRTLR
jgi:regulatory protein NPR1